jgi:hypothetical protein
MVATASANTRPPEVSPGWPRWAAAVLTASGLVIIVAETTSLLFFAGLVLVGLGIYGFVAGARAHRADLRVDVPAAAPRNREENAHGS